jgi:hypothetical protein
MPPQAGAFEERREPSGYLLVAQPFAAAAQRLGLPAPHAFDALLRSAGGASGRARTAIVALPGCDARMHVRPVQHGGWLGPLWGRRLFGLARPVEELRVTARLGAAGAAVPRPVLVAGARRSGPLWEAAVATVHEEGSCDGVALLATKPGREALRAAASAAGRAVRCFHDAGGRHADLHVKNLLFRPAAGGFDVIVIDLDRARAGSAPDASRRMAELMRLYRSLVKRGLLEIVGARGCAAFFAAYTGGDLALRRELRTHLPRERRRLWRHRAGYRLSRCTRHGA